MISYPDFALRYLDQNKRTSLPVPSRPTSRELGRPLEVANSAAGSNRGCMSEGKRPPHWGHVLASGVRSKRSSQETAEAVVRGRNRGTKSAYWHRAVVDIYYAVSSFSYGFAPFQAEEPRVQVEEAVTTVSPPRRDASHTFTRRTLRTRSSLG